MKPRLTGKAQAIYHALEQHGDERDVVFMGEQARFLGMTGYLVTLRVKRQTIHLRAWNPLIEHIEL